MHKTTQSKTQGRVKLNYTLHFLQMEREYRLQLCTVVIPSHKILKDQIITDNFEALCLTVIFV